MSEGELNLIELEHAFGQNDSPIPMDWCILDNQATVNVFCNGKYLENIWKIENYVVIKCNTGTGSMNWMCEFLGYSEPVWYDPGRIVNIISLKRAKKYYLITYHSNNGKGFVVTHWKNGSVQCFRESRKGLFYINF